MGSDPNHFAASEVDRLGSDPKRVIGVLISGRGSNLQALIDAGHVRPVIDSVFPLEQFREAFAKLESGHATGKIVIRVRDEAPQQLAKE